MWCFGRTLEHLPASLLQILSVLHDLFLSQYLWGTILVTLYVILWDWWVLGVGPMLFYGLSCSLFFFCFQLLSGNNMPLLSFYVLLLCGWGLRTDMVSRALSPPCIVIIIIIKKDCQFKVGRGRLTPYQSEDPSPTLPAYKGKEDKGNIVEDKKGESN